MAERGHGITLAYEADPVGAAGVFTTIGEFVGDLPIEFTRTETETTVHNENIDMYVTGVLRRNTWAIMVNYEHGNATHTGLRDHILNGTPFGLRWRGPEITDSTDEIIVSGELTSWKRTTPVREGVQAGEGTFRPSGLMKVDGDIIGA